ncbi:MAG: type III pantothenate kinase [Verrucomicrobiota bacterium]
MAWLLIDNSNSRTKFRLGDAKRLLEWNAVMPTQDLDTASIQALVNGLDFSAVLVASVVPEKEAVFRKVFENTAAYHKLSHESPLGYGFELDAPEQIGHDRLANGVALKQSYGAPGIAIDFGTAVTFSVISANGNFAGGVIAPGMGCMTDYLASKTAQLPRVNPEKYASAIGKNTLEALRIGAVAGHRGMVREILREIVSEIGGDVTVVATGGGAAFAAQSLPEISSVDLDLTLEGLRLVAGRVF